MLNEFLNFIGDRLYKIEKVEGETWVHLLSFNGTHECYAFTADGNLREVWETSRRV